MYNFAKLLTEEPEKLEKVGLLILKFLITILIANLLFGFNISISEFLENPVPKDYTIKKLIITIISFILIWFVLWNLIADLILGEVVVRLLSKFDKDENVFRVVLELSGVIKTNQQKQYLPNRNIITFYNLLQNYSVEDDNFISAEKSRVRQYYIISFIIYIGIFIIDEKSLLWLKWFGFIVVLNFLIATVFLNKAHRYFVNNIPELRKQLQPLSFAHQCLFAINENRLIKLNYKKVRPFGRNCFELLNDNNSLPKLIKFYPFSFGNIFIASSLIKDGMNKLIEQESVKTDTYIVIISDVLPSDKEIAEVKAQNNFAYLYCKNEEEIIENLEILFFEMNGFTDFTHI